MRTYSTRTRCSTIASITQSLLKICFLLFFSQFAKANPLDEIPYLQIRMGHPTITLGPTGTSIDNFFNSVQLSPGKFLCFTANANSYRMSGSDPLCKGSTLTSVIGAVKNNYANCGLWINDVIKICNNPTQLYAFAHAENDCNYAAGQATKSMALLQSLDNGTTWFLVNQIISGMEKPTPNKTTGDGDCISITDDNYHYMYCYRNSDYKTIVARSDRKYPPLTGSWFKYYNGKWESPGLGGNATPINGYGSPSRWLEKNYVMMISSPYQSGGVTLGFSSDRINFTYLQDPLLMSDNTSWNRTPDASELVGYPAVIGEQGGRDWSRGKFIFTYMYLEPGANFGQRYFANRDVTLSVSTTANQDGSLPQVGVELSRWLKQSNGSTEIWTTDAPTPGGFTYKASHGYMMTRQLTGKNAPPTVAIEECVSNWNGYVDHVITPNGICAAAGYKRLRTLGWLYKSLQKNTTALYRCWSPTKYHSHFVSTHSNCEGEKTEYILGYILTV